jgi:hypothetical protein
MSIRFADQQVAAMAICLRLTIRENRKFCFLFGKRRFTRCQGLVRPHSVEFGDARPKVEICFRFYTSFLTNAKEIFP